MLLGPCDAEDAPAYPEGFQDHSSYARKSESLYGDAAGTVFQGLNPDL